MAERISKTPGRYPFSFVIVGDSGAWPDPTADAIFAQLLTQIARIRPSPLVFANLGDFAGPGTHQRHAHYLKLVERLPLPNCASVGNHDRDDPSATDAWAEIHGPTNFEFAHGHTRFIAIDAGPGRARGAELETAAGTNGPGEETLAFLARALEAGCRAASGCAHAYSSAVERALGAAC